MTGRFRFTHRSWESSGYSRTADPERRKIWEVYLKTSWNVIGFVEKAPKGWEAFTVDFAEDGETRIRISHGSGRTRKEAAARLPLLEGER